MPNISAGFVVDPGTSSVAVSAVKGNTTPILYADRAGSSTLANPSTISTRTTFYVEQQTRYTVTVAGTAYPVDLSAGGVAEVNLAAAGTGAALPTPGSGDAGKAVVVNATHDGYELGTVSGGTSAALVTFLLTAPSDSLVPVIHVRGDEFEVADPSVNPTVNVSRTAMLFNLGAGSTVGLQRLGHPGDNKTVSGLAEIGVVKLGSTDDRILAYTDNFEITAPVDPDWVTDVPITSIDTSSGSDLTVADGKFHSITGGDFLVTVTLDVTLTDPA